jgi:hypothetical protein
VRNVIVIALSAGLLGFGLSSIAPAGSDDRARRAADALTSNQTPGRIVAQSDPAQSDPAQSSPEAIGFAAQAAFASALLAFAIHRLRQGKR